MLSGLSGVMSAWPCAGRLITLSSTATTGSPPNYPHPRRWPSRRAMLGPSPAMTLRGRSAQGPVVGHFPPEIETGEVCTSNRLLI